MYLAANFSDVNKLGQYDDCSLWGLINRADHLLYCCGLGPINLPAITLDANGWGFLHYRPSQDNDKHGRPGNSNCINDPVQHFRVTFSIPDIGCVALAAKPVY